MSSLILEGKFGGEQLLPISYSASPMTLTESVQTLAKLDLKKTPFWQKRHIWKQVSFLRKEERLFLLCEMINKSDQSRKKKINQPSVT